MKIVGLKAASYSEVFSSQAEQFKDLISFFKWMIASDRMKQSAINPSYKFQGRILIKLILNRRIGWAFNIQATGMVTGKTIWVDLQRV